MIYVFEDKKDDILSQFFRKAYPEDVADKFIYTNGNGNIKSIVEKLLQTTNEEVLVFLDIYPSNDAIIRVYRKLKELSNKNDNRLVIMPIVCSEYYIIKYLYKIGMVTETHYAEIAINKALYDKVIENLDINDKKFCTTFEKYCKLVLYKWVKECAQTVGKPPFYIQDCPCHESKLHKEDCKKYNLVNKAIMYISEYPYVPNNSYVNDLKKLTANDVWDIHRILVKEFNELSDTLKSIDNSRKYKHICTLK